MASQAQIKPITMDVGKFLRAINTSAQSRLMFLENKVSAAGKAMKSIWRLAAVRQKDLFIEDVTNRCYYAAKHRRDPQGGIMLEDIQPIAIIDMKKKSVYAKICNKLVSAIAESDQKNISNAFRKLELCRFSDRAIPSSGMVRSQDGRTHRLPIHRDVVTENIRKRIVSAVIESLANQVVVKEGRVTSASFPANNIKIPITEWTSRKSIARQMRTVAENAYRSPGFQDRIYAAAQSIVANKLEEAVTKLKPFLIEQQEFTLLNRNRLQRLIENTLATKACFNQRLCDDVTQLVWRTNLSVNHDVILKEWKTAAKLTASVPLLENVQTLEQSRNFEATYNEFLETIFNEAIGPKDIQVDAYRTALKSLKETTKIKQSGDLSEKINELIERLNEPESDHAVIAEVEDLLAEVKNEMNALDNLNNFDEIPGGPASAPAVDMPNGDEPIDDALTAPSAGAGGAGTNVTFNINIGKDGDVSVDPTNPPAEVPATPSADLEGDELDSLFDDDLAEPAAAPQAAGAVPGDGGGIPPAGPAQRTGFENKNIKTKPISESNDPYATDIVEVIPNLGSNYGMKPIEIYEDCLRAVDAMFKLVSERNLVGNAIVESLNELALAAMETAGITVPAQRQNDAIAQVCEVFEDECQRRAAIGEDQYKYNWSYKGGRRRNRVKAPDNPGKPSAVTSEAIQWLQTQDDGMLGQFAGVKFIYDHGGQNSQIEPVLFSEDATIEIPIPKQLRASAAAAAKMTNDDPKPFLGWLRENVVQLQSSTITDDQQLDEAVATVTADADGNISVTVDGDQMGDDSLDNDFDGPSMNSLDDGDVVIADEEPDLGIDFDDQDGSDDDMGDIENSDLDSEAEEEPVAEDRNVTSPDSPKYTATAESNPRENPKVDDPKEPDDELDGFMDGDLESTSKESKLTEIKPNK